MRAVSWPFYFPHCYSQPGLALEGPPAGRWGVGGKM